MKAARGRRWESRTSAPPSIPPTTKLAAYQTRQLRARSATVMPREGDGGIAARQIRLLARERKEGRSGLSRCKSVLVKNNRPCPGLPGKPVHGVAPFPASNSGSPSPDAISTLRQRFGNRADPDHQRLGWRGFLHAAQIQAIPRLGPSFELHKIYLPGNPRVHGCILLNIMRMEFFANSSSRGNVSRSLCVDFLFTNDFKAVKQFFSRLLIHTELYMCNMFAAEFFHDLHEEVMATASRGHGLLIRLQQLEAEFSMVEKAIVSQTGHSNYPHDDG
ncbi:hypothetical protein ZEAMMB73_Zm00001d027498 [Zea mays]|uniref:Protein SCAR n=1 Tax=Zea mays TaxID=4577 RepID=A0A1D6JMJ8_MAIZE|nr:hypothetical protein ZEAMMB73_Zm00001d027498 [Zea mays]